MISRQEYGRSKMVSDLRQTVMASMDTDSRRDSCHELYGDGVKGKATMSLALMLTMLTRPSTGARGYQQRAMGSIIIGDAGDRQWHL